VKRNFLGNSFVIIVRTRIISQLMIAVVLFSEMSLHRQFDLSDKLFINLSRVNLCNYLRADILLVSQGCFKGYLEIYILITISKYII